MTPTNHKNVCLFCKIFGGISYPISCWNHCHLCNKAWGQQKSDLEQQMVKVWWEWDRKAKTEAKQRRAWVKNYRQEGLWRKSFLSHWLAPGTTKYAGTHWERVRFAPPCKLQLNFGSQTGVSSGERTMKVHFCGFQRKSYWCDLSSEMAQFFSSSLSGDYLDIHYFKINPNFPCKSVNCYIHHVWKSELKELEGAGHVHSQDQRENE